MMRDYAERRLIRSREQSERRRHLRVPAALAFNQRAIVRARAAVEDAFAQEWQHAAGEGRQKAARSLRRGLDSWEHDRQVLGFRV